MVNIAISKQFAEFLDGLSRKKDGETFCFYQSEIDRLTIICGEGPCSDWNRLVVGPMIFDGMDVIQKGYPEDFWPGRDTFAGLEIWGGIGGLLSITYKSLFGGEYESFRQYFNLKKLPIPVAKIIDLIGDDSRHFEREPWLLWKGRVHRALREKKPKIHVPLTQISLEAAN